MEINLSPCKRHFLLFLSVIWALFGAYDTFCGSQQASCNMVMILSQDDSGVYRKPKATDDPMYEIFIMAIKSHLPVLMSPPVLYWLTKRTNEGRHTPDDWAARLQQEYVTFLTKDEGFALLVPQEQKAQLDELGFNIDYLSEPMTGASSIKKRFSDPKFSHQTIDPEKLANLFKKNSYFHPVAPKYWYIAGHGLDSIDDAKFKWSDATITELPIYSFVNLLQVFNAINTQSVYVLSCYSSGLNALKAQNILAGTIRDERCPTCDKLQFPVIFQCSMDIVSSLIITDLSEFFTMMQEGKRNGQESPDLIAEQLNKPFLQASPRIKRYANYPTLLMPETGCFQALPLSLTTVIADPVTGTQTIEAPEEKEMVQIYPADLRQLTLHIPDPQIPTIISRVAGRSHHFIGSITTKGVGSSIDIIDNLFLMGVMLAGENDFYCGVSDKAWFVDRLAIADQEEIQGLVVFKGSLKHAKHQAIIMYRDAKNHYYRIASALPVISNTVIKEQIDEETYTQTVKEIYWQTIPSSDALDAATHKTENRADHDNLLIEFGKKLSLALSAPSDEEMIQKDMEAIKKNEINKDNYICYAAHTHDEALIDAIVDYGINDNIFTSLDITHLLLKLIDHEYHPLVAKQVNKLAEQEDTQLLFCVVNAFKYFLHVGLYKHALQVYDDLLICLKKALAQPTITKHKDLIASIQQQLMRFVVVCIEKDCAQIAVDKVVQMLNNADLGMQAIGLIMFQAMQNAGFTNDQLEQKRTLLAAIANRLEHAARSHNAVALYFYEQAMVKQCIACLAA